MKHMHSKEPESIFCVLVLRRLWIEPKFRQGNHQRGGMQPWTWREHFEHKLNFHSTSQGKQHSHQIEQSAVQIFRNSSFTVQWDGKLIEDLTSNEHVDRSPVLLSGVGVEQLQGIPKLSSGIGSVILLTDFILVIVTVIIVNEFNFSYSYSYS